MASAVKFSNNVFKKTLNAIAKRNVHISRVLASKIVLTDYQMETEDIERVNKIPTIRGMDILRNPRLNKGIAFSLTERQILGIHGLLPPAVNSNKVQIDRVITQIRAKSTDLDKYILLNQVLTRNEKLFYQILMDYTEELLPIVYTPTVGKACQEYGLRFRNPNGIFITIHDKGHVYDIITNWPDRRVQVVCMTDGERLGEWGIGLGDLGCNAIGVPIGKLALYTACGMIHPAACLPLMIDVGTNNEELLNDHMYIGLREKRHTGDEYDELIEEIIDALQKRYGKSVLIQFEDFAAHNASRLLDKYRDKICSFNDDIQGTASVVIGGLLGAQRITGEPMKDQKYLFMGAGAAGCGIAHLLVRELMKKYRMSKKEAAKNIYLFDVKGLLTKARPFGEIADSQALFCHDIPGTESFQEAVEMIKPTGIIGVSGQGGAFTQEICQSMAQHCERPIIFSLSNPTSCSECTAEDAYRWTDGKCIFASGSPFPTVHLDGRSYEPSQGNNVYIFPGVALGVIASASRTIPEDMFLVAAETLSEQLSEKDMQEGRVYPPLSKCKEISLEIGVKVAEVAYRKGLAGVVPEPDDKRSLVQSITYKPEYTSNIPKTFPYPEDHAELH